METLGEMKFVSSRIRPSTS